MKTFTRIMVAVAALYALVALAGCNGSSSTTSGLSKTQVESMISQAVAAATAADQQQFDQQNQEIQTLQANQQRLLGARTLVSGGNSAPVMARGLTMAPRSATATCPWSMSSVFVSDGSIWAQTCTGYYTDVSMASSSEDGYIRPLVGVTDIVYFDGASCTGTMYLPPGYSVNGLSTAGLVFTLDPQAPQGMTAADETNAAYYWYVPTAQAETQFSVMSRWLRKSGCEAVGAGTISGYQVLQNDYNVTGAHSQPRSGPVNQSSP